MFIYHKIKKIFDFQDQITLKKNYKKCNKCDGSGLMLLDKPKICTNCNGKICYICENKGSIHIFDECNLCFGKGIY